LIDATTVTDPEANSDLIRKLAKGHVFQKGSRRALVTGKSVIFGLARMFEIHRELAGGTEEIRIFFEMNKALVQLGLPLAGVSPL
jgi:hypothetical protein